MQHQLCAWAEQTHGERLGQGHENFSLNANVFQCFFKKFCLPLHLSHKGQQRRRNTNLTSVSQMQDSAALPALRDYQQHQKEVDPGLAVETGAKADGERVG